MQYFIKIQTCKHYKKGSTDSTVSIQLIGESGMATGIHKLDNLWRDDFEKGRTDTFKITDLDVGRILNIKLFLKHLIREDSWACDNVIIEYGEYVDEFPVYDWIFNVLDVVRGEAILPTSDTYGKVKILIDNERSYNKERFAWIDKAKPGDETWMLPRFTPAKNLHNVPHQLRMEDARFKHMNEMRNAAKFNVLIAKLRALFLPIKKLDDYKELIQHFKIPDELKPYMARWEQDEEQGRQALSGASPFAIRECRTLPPYCKITNDHVKGLLNDGKTLDDELKDGRIFITDYTDWTRGLPRNKRYKSDKFMYCADCLALYYAPGDGKFRPIAIQLKPDDENHVFSPNSAKHDWLLAKMFFRCSDTNAHQV